MPRSADQQRPDYLSIIRNTVLVGGGSVLNMAIGLVRTKVIAVLLGPAGIALFGVFNQIVEVVGATFSLGLGTSGIRQIASSHAAGDAGRVSRIVQTLRRTTWVTGLAGAMFTAGFASLIARLTFGPEAPSYVWPIALLGLAVLFRALTTGQACIVSGTRQIGHFMRISLGGSIASVLAAVPCAYVWGMHGVAPAVVASIGASLLVSWWYSRKIRIADAPCSREQAWHEARLLIAFGLPIMATGIVGTFSPYFERVILLRFIGIEMLGQYQAAFALAGVTVTFVLGVMSADFYPRLVAHADEPERFDAEMNAQIEVALAMALPALAALAAFSGFWIHLLYSDQFAQAADVLLIMSLGVVGRIIASPLRMALLAKHKGKTSFLVESVATGLGLALISILAPGMGLLGCAWAFAALHLLTAALLVAFLPALARQRVRAANIWRALFSIALLGALLANHFLITDPLLRGSASWGLPLAAAAYAFKAMQKRVSSSNGHP